MESAAVNEVSSRCRRGCPIEDIDPAMLYCPICGHRRLATAEPARRPSPPSLSSVSASRQPCSSDQLESWQRLVLDLELTDLVVALNAAKLNSGASLRDAMLLNEKIPCLETLSEDKAAALFDVLLLDELLGVLVGISSPASSADAERIAVMVEKIMARDLACRHRPRDTATFAQLLQGLATYGFDESGPRFRWGVRY